MDGNVHYQVEHDTQGGNPGEVKESRQSQPQDHSVDQRVLLDTARHTKMTVRDQFHFSQHGKHARDSKNAGQNATRGGRHGNGDREPDRHNPPAPGARQPQGSNPGFDDFSQRQVAGHGKTNQGVDHHAGRDGNNDCSPHIPLGIYDFGTTVSDRSKAFEGQYSKCRRTQEIACGSGFARA